MPFCMANNKTNCFRRNKDMSRKLDFKMIYSPYSQNNDEDISVLYDEYRKDKNAVVSIEDKTYYRAIQIFSITIRKEKLIALLDISMKLRVGDTIIDDNGNEYAVKGFAMLSFRCAVPDWYTKTAFVELSGGHENIGHYFAKMQR